MRPLVDAFFTWARAEHEKRPERGLVATALGYSIRHELALRRFLDDGRLRMENNSAERELRAVAVGHGCSTAPTTTLVPPATSFR